MVAMLTRIIAIIFGVTAVAVLTALISPSQNAEIPDRAGSAPVATSSPAPSVLIPTSAKPIQAERVEKTWSSDFTFERKSIEKKHEGIRGYEISVDFPQIAGAPTSSTKQFNRWIRKKIRGYVAEFSGLEEAAEIHDKRKRLSPLHISESLEIDYQVYYADRAFISLRLTHTVMAMGQMHPIDYYETITYDLRKGRELRDLDVFRPGYLSVFAAYSRIQLQETYDLKYIDDDWLKRGTVPKKGNFKNWNVVPDGVLLSFEDYQIAPHTFGQVEMIIPYGELKNVLRPDGIASQFTKRRWARNG